MKTRLICGYLLALSVGVMCRLSGIPLPAPPALIGALVVLAMTLGYVFADKFLARREAANKSNCGGSVG